MLGRITATIGRFFGFGKGHNNGKVAAVGVGKGPETSAGKTKGGLATRGGASIGSGKHSGKSKGEHGKAIAAVAASKVVDHHGNESPSVSDSKGVETSVATSTTHDGSTNPGTSVSSGESNNGNSEGPAGGPQQSSEHVGVDTGGESTGWIKPANSTVSQSGKEAVPVSLVGAGVQQPGALPVPKLATEKRARLRPPKSSSTSSGNFLIRTLQGHTSSVSAVAIRPPDGRQAISASDDRTLRLWDLETGQTLRTFESPDSVWAVAVTPDGHRALSGSYDRTLMLWDLETGQTLRTLKGHTNIVSAVAITPDGLRAVSASWDRTLRLWDLETGQTIRTLEGHTDNVSAVAVTPDGHR
ncbi:MAG: WD40 repeat domain-containing protein, partial [Verrucomicrobia bacterium]|nr:WD40 repeat domain-containing protein [Verrucomicrobiota bacterium]